MLLDINGVLSVLLFVYLTYVGSMLKIMVGKNNYKILGDGRPHTSLDTLLIMPTSAIIQNQISYYRYLVGFESDIAYEKLCSFEQTNP